MAKAQFNKHQKVWVDSVGAWAVVEKITPTIEAMAGGTTSETAVGGMVSKITAAKLATKSGCGVFIASGADYVSVHREAVDDLGAELLRAGDGREKARR